MRLMVVRYVSSTGTYVYMSLPSSPRKKIAIVTGLAERVGVQLQENVEKYLRPIGVSDELRRMSEDFYLQSDILYTSPGMFGMMTARRNYVNIT